MFFDVEGFNRKDSLAFLGMSSTITKGSDTISQTPDIFQDLKDGIDNTPLSMGCYFRAISPYRENDDFKIHIKGWDKNGNGTFYFEMPFKIRTNPRFHISENGLTYGTVFFYDENAGESNNDNIFYQDGQMLLWFEKLSGFDNINGMIYPAMSIMISDSLGHILIDNKNVLADFSVSAIAPASLDSIFPIDLHLSKGLASPKANVEIKVYDLKSQKYLELKTEIEIKPPKENNK